MRKLARYFWLAASATWHCACTGGGTAQPLRATATESQRPTELAVKPGVTAGRSDSGPVLIPPLEGAGTSSAGQERDGSQRLVSHGLRVLRHPSGALELARDYLPAARSVQSLELPSRLGGGFLFSVFAASATLFYRAQSFTADLEPFARLDFQADLVTAGFDRLYVLARRPERIVALDPEHGTALGMGSLPESPSYGNLAFVDGWFGGVQVPFRGTLASFDAGLSWRPVASNATNLEVRDGALRFALPEGVLDLDRSGSSTRRESQPTPVVSPENAVAQALRGNVSTRDEPRAAGDERGRNALKLAVLRGFRDRDSLIVANAGMLLRVRSRDGQLLESDQHAYSGSGECSALRFGRGYGFACADGDQTTLYRFELPFDMRRLRSFSGPRYVASSGNGALVVRGSCTRGALPGAYCVSGDAAEFREIHVRGDAGVERVTALSDGRVAVLVPPRLGAPGFLSLLGEAGQEQRIPLKLPSSPAAVQLLEQGLWLDGFVQRSTGLSGWVAGAEPFAGVRVALDGTVTLARPEGSIDHALLSSTRALLVGPTGRTRESTDGGFDWSDVDLPSEFDAARELRDDERLQGCSELGCAFRGFLRVGWRSGAVAPRLPMAAVPDFTPLLQPGGSRWVLHCEATGEVSEPSLRVTPRARSIARVEEGATPPWAPFFELAAPPLRAAELGFDAAANETDLSPVHAYVWGDRGSDWGRSGHLQLRALDRFQVDRGAFQSAVTRSPWPDANSAAEVFGFDGSGSPTSMRAVMDAGQRAAAVLVSSRGLLDLLLFEDGKSVTRIANAGRLGFGMLSSIAKTGDTWYAAGFNENHSLAVSKISAGRVDRVAEYPDPGRDITSATLVRGVKGDELGIWVAARDWYLYPLAPGSYAIGRPLSRSAADLAQMPAPCAEDADGFLLSGSPSLEASLRFPREPADLTAGHVVSQLIWSARRLCTKALAADTESAALLTVPAAKAVAAATKRGASVPLVLTERRALGRRFGYSCAR